MYEIGDKVVFKDDECTKILYQTMPDRYPKPGTIGKILGVWSGCSEALVQWPGFKGNVKLKRIRKYVEHKPKTEEEVSVEELERQLAELQAKLEEYEAMKED